MSRLKHWLDHLSPRQHLVYGVIFCLLALLGWFVLDRYDVGFIGGFFTGIFAAFGIGFIATYNKTKETELKKLNRDE